MTVPEVVDRPAARIRRDTARRLPGYRSPGPAGLILLADGAARVHRLAGAGIRSRAGTVASGHDTEVTEGDGSDETSGYEPDSPGQR
jgi:hypothetical protein